MANDLKITSSVEAIINDSKSVGGKTYTIKEADKNVGSSSGIYTQEYSAADSVKYTGIVNVTTFTAIGDSAFEGTPTTLGAAPSQAKGLFVKVDSQTGNARTVDVELTLTGTHTAVTNPTDSDGAVTLTGGTTTLKVVLARLSSGEGCAIPLSDTDGSGLPIANIKIKDSGYVNNTAESTVTAVLIGD